jgi:hypothetical protein
MVTQQCDCLKCNWLHSMVNVMCILLQFLFLMGKKVTHNSSNRSLSCLQTSMWRTNRVRLLNLLIVSPLHMGYQTWVEAAAPVSPTAKIFAPFPTSLGLESLFISEALHTGSLIQFWLRPHRQQWMRRMLVSGLERIPLQDPGSLCRDAKR